MDSKLEHNPFNARPKEQKDLDRLESVFRMFDATQRQASECLAACAPLDGSRIENLGGGLIFAIISGKPKFEGLAICTHCMKRASMILRDLVTVVDDMVIEAEKHRK
jgi:hypothetical protein